MRRWINVFCPLIMIFILMSFGFNSASNKIMEVPFTLKVNEPTAVLFPKNKTIFNPVMVAPPFLGSSYIGFKEALAFKESQGDYFTINALGYLGKYQFGIGTLQLMGVYNATRFINDPMLQERAFHTNIARNKCFNGKQIGGVKVTESGILAAAHLAGAGNVKKFLRSLGEHNVSDEFGTSIANYMRKFSGYDISFISPVRNPKI
jgi:hypothetical protein